uniref:Ig-like domain-containing protein n=1 Tax=Zonotrichia albicollis TaxID=44394 RepID=A0A8D2M4V9_ZONAL
MGVPWGSHVGPTLPLAGWCPLSPTGAQTTQLLVEPPWRPAALWDRVTLTCQGSGTAGATTWYKDGQRWWQEGPDRLTVTENGTYECNRTGTGLSLPMRVLDGPTCSPDWLVLQVSARALLEGDTVTLRCRRWRDNALSSVSFYHEEKKLQELRDGTELSLSPLQLQHSGCYSCRGWKSESVTVTVHTNLPPLSFPELFTVPVLEVHSEPTNG